MKILLIFLNIGLILTEKLERTYLPPPGSSLAGGSPGDINIPLELPSTKFISNEGRLSKVPELVKGIDRVSPNEAEYDDYEDMSTHKPKIIYNINTFPFLTKSKSMDTAPLLEEVISTSTIPEFQQGSIHPIDDFDNFRKIHNIEKHPSISIFNETDRVYLPSYKGVYNTDQVLSITLPSSVNIAENIGHGQKYAPSISKDILNPNDVQFGVISSPNYPNNNNNNAISINLHSSTVTNPISSKVSINDKFPVNNNFNNQRSERIQAQADRQATILNFDQSITPEGYVYSYDTSNGIHGDEEGIAINGVNAKGSYSYIGDDGKFYEVKYTADENGFVPKGAHLPTAPPIPDEILKVIEQAAKDKEAGIYDDGSYNEKKYGYKKYGEQFPQPNNIIRGGYYNPENVRNIEKGGIFDEFEDLEGPIESYHNDLGNIDSTINYKHFDHDDNDDLNSPSKNIVSNINDQDPLLTSDLDVSISYKNDKIKPQPTRSGYEYFPPQFYDENKFKSTPQQSMGSDEDYQTNTNHNNTEKVTAKPFLTPYVTRTGEDSEDEELESKHQDTDYDEQFHREKSKDNYENNYYERQQNEHNEPNDYTIKDEIDTREFISGNLPGQQLQFGDRIHNVNNLEPSNGKDYYYQNVYMPLITHKPKISSATAIVATTKFPVGVSIQDINLTSGRPSFQEREDLSSTTPIISISSKSVITLPTTFTPRPGIVNNESTSVNPDVYSNTVSLVTPKIAQTSRPDYTRFDNDQTSTENIAGEDFRGPKQPQRFDPRNGYYY